MFGCLLHLGAQSNIILDIVFHFFLSLGWGGCGLLSLFGKYYYYDARTKYPCVGKLILGCVSEMEGGALSRRY